MNFFLVRVRKPTFFIEPEPEKITGADNKLTSSATLLSWSLILLKSVRANL